MDNYEIVFDDELQHWGIKGQKWGQRRYQNKDGSLTPAGVKRYNKEKEALKKEKAKVKAEEKVLANKKKTQAKIDKLEAEKKALEERKKALKDEARGKTGKEADKNTGETPEQKRERLLKSTDPKEIYKDRDALTYQELNDRVNRIDLEAKLNSRIPEEKGRLDSFNDGMKKTADTINNITNTFKKVDDAYSAVTNSAIGKTLAKQLGLEPPKKAFDLDEFVKKMPYKSAAEIKEVKDRIKNEDTILQEHNKRKNKEKADAEYAKKAAEESSKKADTKDSDSIDPKVKKQVDDYNARWRKDGADDKVTATEYADRSRPDRNNSTDQTVTRGIGGPTRKEKTERYEGTVEGEGTSKKTSESKSTKSKSSDYYDPIDLDDSQWRDVTNKTVSNVPATTSNRGQSYVAGYLESKGNDDFKYVERKRDGDDWTYVYDK